jgi:gamma-butyrobetaine dioxygenase
MFFSDATLLDWLENIATYGIALIDNAPPQEDQLRRVANRVGFIRRTQYG